MTNAEPLLVTTITIELSMSPEGDVQVSTGLSGDPNLMQALGMLEMARDDIKTIIEAGN